VADIPDILYVRTAVVENALTLEQLHQRGITHTSIAASFGENARGWVAVHEDEIVGFSIADLKAGCLFALFVLPAYERRGIGGQLLTLALDWLWQNGAARAWLHTAPRTKAAPFYQRRGWRPAGTHPTGDVRLEHGRPARCRRILTNG
jgi:GNAT superfamily N-acetyltransferase